MPRAIGMVTIAAAWTARRAMASNSRVLPDAAESAHMAEHDNRTDAQGEHRDDHVARGELEWARATEQQRGREPGVAQLVQHVSDGQDLHLVQTLERAEYDAADRGDQDAHAEHIEGAPRDLVVAHQVRGHDGDAARKETERHAQQEHRRGQRGGPPAIARDFSGEIGGQAKIGAQPDERGEGERQGVFTEVDVAQEAGQQHGQRGAANPGQALGDAKLEHTADQMGWIGHTTPWSHACVGGQLLPKR